MELEKSLNPGHPEQPIRKRRTRRPAGPAPGVFLWVYSTHFKACSGKCLINHFVPPTDHRQKALIFVSFLYPKCVDRRGFSALVFSISFVTPLHSIIHILFLVFFE